MARKILKKGANPISIDSWNINIIMKKILKILIVTGIVPFLINIITVPFLPNEIPIHYDMSGRVDRIGSKFEVLIFPVLILIITLFWITTIKCYKNRMLKSNNKNEKDTENILLIGQLAIGINFIYNLINIYYLLIVINIFSAKSLNVFSGASFATVLIVSGLATKSAKRNSLFGIRTKWTLLDDYCWVKTNNLGANLLIVSGIIIALFFTVSSFSKILIVIIVLTLVVFILVLYSYYVYKTRGISNNNNPKR